MNKNRKLTRRQVDSHRQSIRVGVIIDRLTKNSCGDLLCAECERNGIQRAVEMKPSQVKAAEILLNKVMPSMQSIENYDMNDEPDKSPEELLTEYWKELPSVIAMDESIGVAAIQKLCRDNPALRSKILAGVPDLKVV